jgi:hypothetical protein
VTTDFSPIWQGATVVILASGPSLNAEDVEAVRVARSAGKCRVIAINNTWERAPWADALYACDAGWWEAYQPEFKGERWSQHERAAEFGANRIEGKPGNALSFHPDHISHGGNSGFQAINLALHMGAAKIVLLGFDMQATGGKSHWHGDHERARLTNPKWPTFIGWHKAMNRAHDQLDEIGLEHINASRETALESWPRMTIQEALA